MSLTVAEFLISFPEFATVDAARLAFIDRKLQEAARRINADYLGDRADDAQGYLAAHLITKSGTSGTGAVAGGIASVRAGSASVSYFPSSGASSGSSSGATTGYEQEYLNIVKLAGPGMRVLNE